MRTRQLIDLVNDAYKRSDTENATALLPFADVVELINQGWTRVYGRLCETGQNYYLTQFSFSTVPNQDTYYTTAATGVPAGTALLPTDMYKVRGVDAQSTQTNAFQPCDTFEFEQRCDYQQTGWAWPVLPRYDYQGSGATASLRFIPSGWPNVVPIRLWYFPSAVRLVANSDTFDGGNGWEIHAIDWAAKRMATKDENWELVQMIDADLTRFELDLQHEAASRNAGHAPKIRRSRYRRSGDGAFGVGGLGGPGWW